ncbi:unnamed protein product, partial [Vitis vinifera]
MVIQTNNTGNQLASPNDIQSNVISGGGSYLMNISLGTPPVSMLGIADTGSDLIWRQCLPCDDCYKQVEPLFDPKKSKTYKTLGYLSSETFTIGSTEGDPASFPGLAFGCGHSNGGTFNEKDSGLIGLGGGPLSLVMQLSSKVGGQFSYCLVPLSSDSTASSKINFGKSAVVSGSGTSSPAAAEESNIIIDSGTTLTLLPRDFYTDMESALTKVIGGQTTTDPRGTFSLCYSGVKKLEIPTITAHFIGADVQLPPLNTFVQAQEDLVCFSMIPSSNLAIFGNLSQMNFLVGYDLKNNKVSFKPTDCTKQ